MEIDPAIKEIISEITEEIEMHLRGLTEHEQEIVLVAIKDDMEQKLDPDREYDVLDDDYDDDDEF